MHSILVQVSNVQPVPSDLLLGDCVWMALQTIWKHALSGSSSAFLHAGDICGCGL